MMQHSIESIRAPRVGAGGLAIADFYIFTLQPFNSPLDESAVADESRRGSQSDCKRSV